MDAWNGLLGVTLLVAVSGASWAAGPFGVEEFAARDGLPNFFAKLERGEPVRIAYLGGSITDAEGWRVMTHEWFQEQYPDVTVEALNAAHSGTTSDLACFRLERDLLPFNPDLIFIEFAVNDGIADKERIYRGIEGVVRKARRANPLVDVCLVYTLAGGYVKCLQEGRLPHTYEAMEAIAEHCGLPSILLGLEVLRLEKSGDLIFHVTPPKTDEEKAALEGRILFSYDGVHPTKEGHAFYRDAVARAMEKLPGVGKPGPAAMPEPFRKDNFEYAAPTPLSKVKLSPGWRKLDPETDPMAKRFQAKLPELWFADRPGEMILVRFKGTSIMLYDVVGPDCCQVMITVDDQPPTIKPRFDAWCQDHRVYYLIAATGLEDAEHVVRFEISPEQPDKAAILAQRGIDIDDPAHYDGTTWYVGDVLVTGEVLDPE